MAIGTWFLPVCNLFMPKQIANDVWAATKPAVPWAYGIRQPTQRGLLNGWWTMWVIYFCIKFAVTWDNWWDADTVDDAKGTLAVHIFADFFSILRSYLCPDGSFFRRLTIAGLLAKWQCRLGFLGAR